jgi:hypothetical protein
VHPPIGKHNRRDFLRAAAAGATIVPLAPAVVIDAEEAKPDPPAPPVPPQRTRHPVKITPIFAGLEMFGLLADGFDFTEQRLVQYTSARDPMGYIQSMHFQQMVTDEGLLLHPKAATKRDWDELIRDTLPDRSIILSSGRVDGQIELGAVTAPAAVFAAFLEKFGTVTNAGGCELELEVGGNKMRLHHAVLTRFGPSVSSAGMRVADGMHLYATRP